MGGRNQHRESADLRVRPLGIPPKRRDPTASPTAWIGNRGSRHLKQAMHPNGSTALLSTFYCSTLSASGRADLRVRPLGIPPKTPVPTGSPTGWIGNPNVDPSADTAGSTPHRHPPQPFPEGEILDSPGFAAQRLPWVGDSHNRPEPCRVRLTRGSRKPVSPSVSGPGKDDRIPPAIPPSGPRQASPFRADAICLSCHPG